MIEPSATRYRSAVAMARLATALGIQLDTAKEDCECLERLADQAERLHVASRVEYETPRYNVMLVNGAYQVSNLSGKVYRTCLTRGEAIALAEQYQAADDQEYWEAKHDQD